MTKKRINKDVFLGLEDFWEAKTLIKVFLRLQTRAEISLNVWENQWQVYRNGASQIPRDSNSQRFQFQDCWNRKPTTRIWARFRFLKSCLLIERLGVCFAGMEELSPVPQHPIVSYAPPPLNRVQKRELGNVPQLL